MVSMILLLDMVNRQVVIIIADAYYITILRANTNTTTRTEGGKV